MVCAAIRGSEGEMSGIIDYKSQQWIDYRNKMIQKMIEIRSVSEAAWAKKDIKTCISCGSGVQPCCGH
jgi:3-mercaptopyruvate sulfurtransferase SseA